MQRAMLAWCHRWHSAFPNDVRTAHHFINWCGEMALAACVTDADYNAVAACYEISVRIINHANA
jgi:uncharacterized cupin superfamily protein